MIESYAVGIDLGTTNAVLAYIGITGGQPVGQPQVLPIGQWVADGVWQEKPLLPTFRYHTLPHEQDLLAPLPFPYKPVVGDFPVLFGEFAVKLGALNRGQGVASAKSWLSQASRVHQDSGDAFLPFGVNQEASASVPLVSPVTASASYLQYLHAWWNHCFPDHSLSNQSLVITVPASFDEYARDLTLTAAEMAGLSNITLLEEPTAAAYAWRDGALTQPSVDPKTSKDAVGIMCVLDVGGGTTDLSLIDFRDPQKPRRLAVGDHLMLGGDNLDAAIAQRGLEAMSATGQKNKVSPAQWSQLMLGARDLKEQAFGATPPLELKLNLLGRGKSLIGQQRQGVLNTDETRSVLLNGFLPRLDFNSEPSLQPAKSGLVQVGLKFEANPAITSHLLAFISQLDQPVNTVLLNGGFFESSAFCEEIAAQFKHWSLQKWQQQPVQIVRPELPQLSVALGAALYSQARITRSSALIGGGAARSLILELDSDEKPVGLCVMAKGTQEGVVRDIQRTLDLRVNSPVAFTLYSTTESVGEIGEVVPLQSGWLKLPSLQTVIEVDVDDTVQTRQVQLLSEITTVGALQLQFKSTVEDLVLPPTYLEFAGRSAVVGARIHKEHLPLHWGQLETAILAVYGPRSASGKVDDKGVVATLRKTLDQVLGVKQSWDMTVCRCLTDVLLRWQKNRRRSARHEALWLSLVGFALRPGYGAVGDSHRIEHVLNIIAQPPAYHEHGVWHAWWTLIRRCAGGLDEASQLALFQAHEAKLKSVMTYLKGNSAQANTRQKLAAKEKKGKGAKAGLSKKEQDLKNRAPEAMLGAVASLSALRGKTWFEPLLFGLYKSQGLGVSQQIIAWCCAQVATPDGRLDLKLLESQVLLWLQEDWKVCPEYGLAASIAVQVRPNMMCLPEKIRQAVELQLRNKAMPDAWSLAIHQGDSRSAVQEALSGERLPQGLKVATDI